MSKMQEESGMDPADFQSFTWVCKGLPGVKPRVTQAKLRDLLYHFAETGKKTASVGEAPVTVEELAGMFCEYSGYYGTTERVSPAGAACLVRLYEEQALEMTGKGRGEVSEELLAYCDSEPALRAKVQARKEAKAAYEAKLADPTSFTENEFTFTLLNDLFWRHVGKEGRSLTVGDVEVHKNVVPFRSNSGKTTDFRVSFHWTGADGMRHEQVKSSEYESNRRNDEERNWGLPE